MLCLLSALMLAMMPKGCQASYYLGICDSNPCKNGGTCLPSGGDTYMCLCADGYPQDDTNPNCENPTNYACDSSPCHNLGECVNGILDVYTCYCFKGWTGDNCDIPPAECVGETAITCLNGGVCACIGDSNYAYVNGLCTEGNACRCPAGYSGDFCELQ